MKTKNVKSGGFTLVEIMIVVAIIGLLATMAVPNFMKARQKAQQKACISNLLQLDGAKQTWALESKASPTTVPAIAQIQPYLGRGTAGTAPVCPADPANSFATSYSMNDLQTPPACLVDPASHHLD
jgi:prepilin-type N-terminal cleavage/methylation domain-containing protein